jgi:hypothetical protein
MRSGFVVATTSLAAERVFAEAELEGTIVLRIDSAGAGTLSKLLEILGQQLRFPTISGSVPSAIDWLGDLSWIHPHRAMMLGVTGPWSESHEFLEVLAFAADRQRSRGRTFCVVLQSGSEPQVQETLASINRELEQVAREAPLSDTRPLEVHVLKD